LGLEQIESKLCASRQCRQKAFNGLKSLGLFKQGGNIFDRRGAEGVGFFYAV